MGALSESRNPTKEGRLFQGSSVRGDKDHKELWNRFLVLVTEPSFLEVLDRTPVDSESHPFMRFRPGKLEGVMEDGRSP